MSEIIDKLSAVIHHAKIDADFEKAKCAFIKQQFLDPGCPWHQAILADIDHWFAHAKGRMKRIFTAGELQESQRQAAIHSVLANLAAVLEEDLFLLDVSRNWEEIGEDEAADCSAIDKPLTTTKRNRLKKSTFCGRRHRK